jgi:transposase
VQKRASKSKGGIYPVSFKIKAIKRVERGEGVLPVARDIGGTRKNYGDAASNDRITKRNYE